MSKLHESFFGNHEIQNVKLERKKAKNTMIIHHEISETLLGLQP